MFGLIYLLIFLPYMLLRAAFMLLRGIAIILMVLARYALRNSNSRANNPSKRRMRRTRYPTVNGKEIFI